MTDLLKEIKEKRVETLNLADVQPEEIGATTYCIYELGLQNYLIFQDEPITLLEGFWILLHFKQEISAIVTRARVT